MQRMKSKTAFSLILFAAGTVFIGMAVYLAHIFLPWDIALNLPQYCLNIIQQSSEWHVSIGSTLFILIGLTFSLIFWKTGKQIVLSRRLAKRLNTMDVRSLTEKLNKQLGKQDIIVVHGTKPLAFTTGFLKPRIILSTELLDLLDDKELQAVVLHEDYHRRHRDPLKMFVVSLLSDALWFLPVLKRWMHDYRMMRELLADKAAIQTMGSQLELSSALLKLIHTGLVDQPASSVPFADQTVNDRLKLLIDTNTKISTVPKKNATVLSAVILFVFMATVFGGCI